MSRCAGPAPQSHRVRQRRHPTLAHVRLDCAQGTGSGAGTFRGESRRCPLWRAAHRVRHQVPWQPFRGRPSASCRPSAGMFRALGRGSGRQAGRGQLVVRAALDRRPPPARSLRAQRASRRRGRSVPPGYSRATCRPLRDQQQECLRDQHAAESMPRRRAHHGRLPHAVRAEEAEHLLVTDLEETSWNATRSPKRLLNPCTAIAESPTDARRSGASLGSPATPA